MIQLRPESPEELRERLRQMSDPELRRFGRQARKLSDPKMNFFSATAPYLMEVEEARAEWRRRHPPASQAPGPGIRSICCLDAERHELS